MEVKRNRIEIVPENEIDEAFIEEVLGLKKEGECGIARRVDVMGTSALAYIYIENVVIKE